MTELIKEVTPPKKPDLSNPYQAASPVKITPTVTKTRGKRPRLNGRVTKPQKGGESDKESDGEKVDEVKEYSAQAIIEATVPKVCRTSRIISAIFTSCYREASVLVHPNILKSLNPHHPCLVGILHLMLSLWKKWMTKKTSPE